MNHCERYIDACHKIKRFQGVAEEESFLSFDMMYDAYMSVDENLPTMSMHTSVEQKLLLLGATQIFRKIGAYSPSELRHGRNVLRIETTAIYNFGKDEFVIHTPNLTRSIHMAEILLCDTLIALFMYSFLKSASLLHCSVIRSSNDFIQHL